jgi:hypothetical protein
LLSHLRSYERYDEPETLPYSIRPFCPMSADGGQSQPDTAILFMTMSLTTDFCIQPSFVLWPRTKFALPIV